MSEPASPPRRTINDLPTELKQRIVELCAEQDERYQQWFDSIDTVGKVELTSLAKRNARVGCSVGSIFQVSKLFSILAAPYIFKVLKSSRMNIHFRCLVSTTRLPLFSTLHIDSPDVTEAVIVLPRLSNLKHLVLQDDYHAFASYGLLDNPTPSPPVAGYAATAFKSLTGLTSLRVRNLHLPYLAQLLALWAPALSKLDLVYSLDHFDGIDCLAPSLATATQLEELHLTFLYDDEDDVADLSSLQQGITNYPPVARLFLQPEILHSSHLTFANSFSSTLTHLSLACTLNNGGEPFHHTMPRFSSEVFPSVSSLTVKGEHPVVKSTINSIQARHFPSLTSLTLDISHVSDWRTALSFLPRLPNLATLSIPALQNLRDDQFSVIRTLAAEIGLELLRSKATSQAGVAVPAVMLPGAGVGDASMPTFESKCDAVQTTLNYVQERMKAAREAGEEDFVSRVSTALRTFELERAATEVWSKM